MMNNPLKWTITIGNHPLQRIVVEYVPLSDNQIVIVGEYKLKKNGRMNYVVLSKKEYNLETISKEFEDIIYQTHKEILSKVGEFEIINELFEMYKHIDIGKTDKKVEKNKNLYGYLMNEEDEIVVTKRKI